MPEYRFGVSLLSKDRFDDAYNEEVMIDKFTGEVLVKTQTGDTISYNYNSRLKSHIIETKSIANNMSIYGDIINVEMDNDVYAPFIMEFDKNYITNTITIPYYNCKKILFNVDIDAITVNKSGISSERNNLLLDMELLIYYNDDTTSDPIVISESIDQINHKVFNLTDDDFIKVPKGKVIAGFVLTSFKVKNYLVSYSGEITENTKNIRPIFNSLFAVVQV